MFYDTLDAVISSILQTPVCDHRLLHGHLIWLNTKNLPNVKWFHTYWRQYFLVSRPNISITANPSGVPQCVYMSRIFMNDIISTLVIVHMDVLFPPRSAFCLYYKMAQYSTTMRKAISMYIGRALTRWGRVTHICVSNLTIIGSDNDLRRRHDSILTNAGILSIRILGTNFSEIRIGILSFPFKNMLLKISFVKCRPFCLVLVVI